MAYERAPEPADPTPADRLDSWKAIAAYLDRDVRTVQRWEVREGMPVHRHQHDQQASVYAYRTELDDWRRSRGPKADAVVDVAAESAPQHPRARISWLAGGAAIGVVALFGLLVAAWSTRQPQPPATTPFIKPLTLLLSEVGAPSDLEPLARDLRRDVLDEWRTGGGIAARDDRIRSFLPLMRHPADARLTPTLASELAVRAGGVHLVGGLTVDRRESTVRLTLTAWAGDGVHREVARVQEEAPSIDALHSRVRGLTRRLAEVASSAPPAAGLGFRRVTTAVLSALQLYDEADHLMLRQSWEAAVPLLREAIEADPAFASAHIHLAWVLSNLGRPRREWEPLIARAESLRSGVSEVERSFITGSAMFMRGNPAGSTASWERVLGLEPDHYWALGNLALVRNAQGDDAGANDLRIARARAHPESLVSQVIAAEIVSGSRARAAQPYVARVAELAHSATSGERWFADVWLPLAQGCEAWLRKDVVTARSAADHADAAISTLDSTKSADAHYSVALLYLSLGLGRHAYATTARVAHHDERDQVLALVLASRGEWDEVRRLLRGFSTRFPHQLPAAGPLLSEAGLTREAAGVLAAWDREPFWPDWLVAPLRASVLADRGDRDGAQRVLEGALPNLRNYWRADWISMMPTSTVPLFAARRLQARLLVAGGRLDAAIAALEEGKADEAVACNMRRFGGAAYLAMLGDLAGLYRQRGDTGRAMALESDIRDRLALADPDFPLLQAVRSEVRVSLSPSR